MHQLSRSKRNLKRSKHLSTSTTLSTTSTRNLTLKLKSKPSSIRKQPFSITNSHFSTSSLDATPPTTHISISPQFIPPHGVSKRRQMNQNNNSNRPLTGDSSHHTSNESFTSHSLSDPVLVPSNTHPTDVFTAFAPSSSNTQLYYPSNFTPNDIALIEHHSKQTITTFSLKSLVSYGYPSIQNAITSARFLYNELPSRYAQRIEMLRDFPFEVNRHPLIQQIQQHYLQSLKLITSVPNPPHDLNSLHDFNKVLLQLIYQSSLLPSSTLSHCLCTAFGDILLQQLMMTVEPPLQVTSPLLLSATLNNNNNNNSINNNTTPTNNKINPTANTQDISLQPPPTFPSSTSIPLPATTDDSQRDAIFTIVNDSATSLTLFNSVLQEALDSFNVSRLDTRLLMTQHCTFCQQLFQYLGIQCEYPLKMDAFSPSGHDEFGHVIGSEVQDFFSKLHEDTSIFNQLTFNPTQNNNNDTSTTTSSTQSSSTPSTYDTSNYHSVGHFNIKDGYNGHIGILAPNLSFSEVIADVLPYSAHLAGTRYVQHTLTRSFTRRHRGLQGLEASGILNDNNDSNNNNNITSPDNISSEFEPLDAPQPLDKTNIIPQQQQKPMNRSAMTKILKARQEDREFEAFTHDLVKLDKNWADKAHIQLKQQLKNISQHPSIPNFQTTLLELPPLEITVPDYIYTKNNKTKNTTPTTTNESSTTTTNESSTTTSTESSTTSTESSTTILVPFPKIRINGDLDYTFLWSRPHANVVIREILSNSIENTIKNTLELTGTTTKHLIRENLLPNMNKWAYEFHPYNKKQPELVSPPDDPRHNIITGGLLPNDYLILNQHCHIPPIEVWLVKSTSKAIPDTHATPLHPNHPLNSIDDVYSIKISDRGNGLSQSRAEAVLTYGNMLLNGHLNQVRTYKAQQAKLHEYLTTTETLKAIHYNQYSSTINSNNKDLSLDASCPPFLPPPLPENLLPENLISVTIPTAENYGSNALNDICREQPPRGFGLPLARATVNYLKGKLTLTSIDGFGTDVFIRLKL